jgi:hypothetical protein
MKQKITFLLKELKYVFFTRIAGCESPMALQLTEGATARHVVVTCSISNKNVI